MLNRRALQERRKVRQIIERAAQKARSPGLPSAGTSGGGSVISPRLETRTLADEDGNTIRDFVLGVDVLGDAGARLRVQGVTKNYGS